LTRKSNTINGAESLVHALVDSGIEVCFSNPGTSEMHFVAALDKIAGMRCVLGLFEGVVTGAADGYWRMKDKPAVTLLHLGPGLGNGLANLHNAKKAQSGIVNIIGEHATYHVEYDAPLTADIEGIAGPVSHWVKTSKSSSEVAQHSVEAINAACTYPGQIASLILPANTAWEPAAAEASANEPTTGIATLGSAPEVADSTIESIAEVLKRGEPTAFIITGHALRERSLATANKIAAAHGAELLAQTSNARLERGAGRVAIESVPYPVDAAVKRLAGFKHIICVGAKAPVAFFAYPDKPSTLYPEDASVHVLSQPHEDSAAALDALAERLQVTDNKAQLQVAQVPELPGACALDSRVIAQIVANLIPDNAIVVDEGITASRDIAIPTAGAAPHDWLQICGGSIGIGFPLAIGAAVACPDRKVIALQADGSGMYTLQGLWTQARENLDVTTIVLSNRAYAILKHELRNVGAISGDEAGSIAHDMMELNRPELDWVSLARGMGVEAVRVTDSTGLIKQLRAGLAAEGPYLIEAVF
jgi:acetolactate synthase-1/2/3 large subunit